MFRAVAQRVFGTPNERTLRQHRRLLTEINALEEEAGAASDEALRGRTEAFRSRVASGESLDGLLPEAFATVREAARRALGQRPYDVQLIGGIVLHQGNIAEMKTGEGKTLVATLPVYLNALSGKGVHVVTVNDYLARRDADWMGQIYRFLGLSVGCVVPGLAEGDRREAYASDVVYGTNNEFGFDYLRDNMKLRLADMVQRPFHYAIVDEVDSILIDEARTPLIISGPSDDISGLYEAADRVVPRLVAEDLEIDEKSRSVSLTEKGSEHAESLLRTAGLIREGGLYDFANVAVLHHFHQGLRARHLYQRDRDYIVREGQVVIIDEFTGRMMEGRRYSEGLHQALEAKEGVEIKSENQTLASVTFQNYFRLYPKLAGMTGTAVTEAAEFGQIYGLDVVEVPTHQAMIREDHDDEVYRTAEEKWKAVVDEIVDARERRQPILVGTTSIETSETLSRRLRKARVPHEVLNARHHAREAAIIAQAGVPGSVTIATNMAGRGTDIQLGGNVEMRLQQELAEDADGKARERKGAAIAREVDQLKEEAISAGGLYVLGTERHESRRVDNQLRGRSGRQGDPGRSKFYLSLEDDLMRIFGSDRLDGILRKLGLEDGEAIIHPWVNRALEKAQQKVEQRNFEVRKNLLRFDDVMNEQRKVIYEQRREFMDALDVQDTVVAMRHEVVDEIVGQHIPPRTYPEQWDLDGLAKDLRELSGQVLPVKEWATAEGADEADLRDKVRDALDALMANKESEIGTGTMRVLEKQLLLQILDRQWKEHLQALEHLRRGIGLRAFGQRDPLNEYKREALELFEVLLSTMRAMATRFLLLVTLNTEAPQEAGSQPGPAGHRKPVSSPPRDRVVMPNRKIGRNEACPCGSGRKYKHCHGRSAAGRVAARR